MVRSNSIDTQSEIGFERIEHLADIGLQFGLQDVSQGSFHGRKAQAVLGLEADPERRWGADDLPGPLKQVEIALHSLKSDLPL